MARITRRLLENSIVDGEPLEAGTLIELRADQLDARMETLTEPLVDDDDGPVRVAADQDQGDDDGKPQRRSRRAE